MEAYTPRNAQERTWQIIDMVGQIAETRGASLAQVSLAWLSAQPAVTSVILGARNQEQLADNLGAATLQLNSDELAALGKVSEPETNVYPYGVQADQQRHRSITGGR